MPSPSHNPRHALEAAALLERHGVILRREATAAGLTTAQIDRRVRRGHWVTGPVRGTLIVASHAANPEAHLTAATVGLGAIAWGRSALALWSLDDHPNRPVVARSRHGNSPNVALSHVTDLSSLPTTTRCGIQTAPLEVTVASMANQLTRRELDELVDDVLRNRRTTWPRIAAVFESFARPSRPGAVLLRAVLADRSSEDAVPLSAWSRDFANKLVESGLRMPDLEWRVTGRAGSLIAQVDLAYPALRYAIELDSVAFHHNRIAFHVDRDRDARLTRAGWRVSRFTWQQYVDDWPLVVETVRAVLTAG